MATQVVKLFAEEAAKSLRDESPSVIQHYVRKIFQRVAAPTDQMYKTKDETPKTVDVPMALTPEQLARIRGVALETARAIEPGPERAELLADSLVGGLVVQPT